MTLKEYLEMTVLDHDLGIFVSLCVLYMDEPLEFIYLDINRSGHIQICEDDDRIYQYLDCKVVGQLFYSDCGALRLTISIEEKEELA